MCRFKGSSLYLEPKKSNGYPSEIIDRRLYLGDKTHAENETVLSNLGITHILNVTHNIPNTFEESKNLMITYKRISIEDSADVPIELSFNLAYDFIESAFSKKKVGKTKLLSTQFDLLQNFQDSRKKSMIMVSGAAMTNDLILDLNSKSSENVENRVKDRIYDIDTVTTYNMQNSNNQNRVLVHCAMGRSRSATMVIMYLMRKFQIDWNLSFDIVKMRRDIIDPNEGFLTKLREYEGKQYKIRRTITNWDFSPFNGRIKEENEDEYSQASDDEESSSSSSEDLMERKYSLDV